MSARVRRTLAGLTALCCLFVGLSQVRSIPLPSKRPLGVDIPQKRPDAAEEPDDDEGDAGVVALPEMRPTIPERADARTGDDDEPDAVAETDEETEEIDLAAPPIPSRAPPPSLRRPRIAAEKLGPPPPPETWSEAEIAEAKAQCAKTVSDEAYAFKPLEPVKDGVCGMPAPIRLAALKLTPEVEITPHATMTCVLAAALNRWMVEVVQPRAKDLLDDQIVSLTNISSYHCRTRYNDPRQRISHHAFGEALDISAFGTAKGQRISVLDDWEGEAPRNKFLREIHAGACRIFGTVLGPEANAAHKSHFHLDMAKRRHGSYCQ